MLMKPTDSIDISFSLPLVQRMRFTQDISGADASVLHDLLEPSGNGPARVQVWMDEDFAIANQAFVAGMTDSLESSPEQIALTEQPNKIAGGEACKNDPAVIDDLLTHINDHDLDRRSYVIVVGGGAVLDAVGYAAAIAHRGIRLIRIPTTTLAQADSGVGVKNAVNWHGKKNWKGTFSVPWAVINDASALTTLSDRDFRSGFSEVVKVSLLKDADIFETVCETANGIRQRDPEAYLPAVRASVGLHLDHITRGGDPFEMLEARPLDFGHWSAHRLEAITNYEVRHGEAVAIGLAIDCVYSRLVLGLPSSDCDRIIDCLLRLGLPINHAALSDSDLLFQGLEEFRQHLGGRLTITLLRGVGQPVDVHEIEMNAMREAIAQVQAFSTK